MQKCGGFYDITYLSDFKNGTETGSFRKAAEFLGLTPAASVMRLHPWKKN